MPWTPIFTAPARCVSSSSPPLAAMASPTKDTSPSASTPVSASEHSPNMGTMTVCVAGAIAGFAAVVLVCSLVGIAVIVACAAVVIIVAPVLVPIVAPIVGMVVGIAAAVGGSALAVVVATLGTFGFTATLPGAGLLGAVMHAELGRVVSGSLFALARDVVMKVVALPRSVTRWLTPSRA
ncbi:hypothetical protein AB1N83_007099 [Pleurotus pulmonarius]